MTFRKKKEKQGEITLMLVFASGATVHVHVTDWAFEKNHGTTKLTWVSADGTKRRLIHANLDHLDCIVRVGK